MDKVPFERQDYRTLPRDFAGDVFVWDVDKTYLDTDFETLAGLLSIPFEFAVDKRSLPGAAALLAELRRGPGKLSRQTPLYFISASPVQMRRVLEKKMILDGVDFDGLTLKDQLANIRAMRFDRLMGQVSFKLSALFAQRAEMPIGAMETLFGDDAEMDALVYCLYADAVAGRISAMTLREAAVRGGMSPRDAEAVIGLLEGARRNEAVERIYIFTGAGRKRFSLDGFGPRVRPVRDAMHAAGHLFGDGKISAEGAGRVTGAMLAEGVAGERLRESYELARQANAALAGIEFKDVVEGSAEAPAPPRQEGSREPWTPERFLP